MRVLITGATGFAGSHLTELCASLGAAVVALGTQPRTAASPLEHVENYIQADLAVPDEARRALAEAAPERIFHLAAAGSVAHSWTHPLDVLRENHLITLNLLEAIRTDRPTASVLVACSSEEYGPPARLPVTEDAPLRPQNPYAASKTTADVLAAFYGDAHGLNVARARAFNHAGPRQSEVYVVSGLARQIALAERSGADEVTVTTGNLDVRRDFVDVRDVVRAYWRLLEDGGADVYNVCAGRSVSIADIIAGLAEHTALAVGQETDPALLRQNEVMDVIGSYEKLSRATGWEPEIELSRTLGDALAWWRGELA